MALRSYRILGALLFAASLFALVLAAAREAAIAGGLVGAPTLLLFLATRARIALTGLILMTLTTFGCALFSALLLRDVALLGVSVLQILALMLLDGREHSNWLAREIGADRLAV